MEPPSADSDPLVVPGATLRRLMGLWRPQGRVARRLNGLLAGFIIATLAFLPACVALKLYVDPPEELERITLCSLATSICIGFLFKAALFVAQGATLRQTVRQMEDIRRRFGSGEENQRTRRRYQKLSNSVYLHYQMVAVPAVIGWVLCPLLSRTVMRSDEDHQEVPRQLPVPVWLPVDVYASPTYELLYVVHSFCALVAAESSVCTDIFFIHMMLMVAAELEVLNDNISAMRHFNMRMTSTGRQEYVSRNESDVGQSVIRNSDQPLGRQTMTENVEHEWIHQQLVKNVLHHQAILRSVSLLQSAMNVSIFSLLFFNMANLCSSLFVAAVLVQRDGNVGKALNALFSIPALLYETRMYCIYGHIMTDQSEKLTNSAFSCGWVHTDARFTRSLVIFMTASVRPIVITVGKTCKLSKQMLLQVLNGTYGLLNMLYYLQSSK
nr:odorant receptor SameORX [Schistocerca americana]